MYLSWRWIGEMVDLRGTAAEDPRAFVDRFVLAVAEVDGVHRRGEGLEAVRVGRIAAVRPHPNADKLRLTRVDLGAGEDVEVVCGAPNVAVDMLVAFVPPGVTLPSGVQVRDGEVRGVRSPGMLASERELGLSDEHEGLMLIDAVGRDGRPVAVGAALPDALPIRDVLYEIDNKSVTHRPDLWGHLGFAREVAALVGRPLRLPPDAVAEAAAPPLRLGVQVEAAGCRRYLAARFEGVAVGPSPLWARLRLRSLGVRPISNVVDATNLAMLETGNPLHAFDAAAIRGERIVVRAARPGEAMTTLDGQLRTLAVDDLVIADGEGALALAGVMGGAESEIGPQTRALLLEAANFDGAAIRKTSARLGLRSESSARFEKGLAPEMAAVAARRFAHLLAELCPGARLASTLADAGSAAGADGSDTPVIATTTGYLRQRLGLDAEALPDARIAAVFAALGFALEARDPARYGEGAIAVRVPWFRAGRDVAMADDLVEELGRQYGYDRVPSRPLTITAAPTALPPMRALERQLRAVLALGRAMNEVHQYSFDHEPTRSRLDLVARDAAGAELPRVRLRNCLSSEHIALRRDVASGLLAALERNLSHGLPGQAAQRGLRVSLFELGRGYLPERALRGARHLADADALGARHLANATAAPDTRGARHLANATAAPDYGLPQVLIGDAGPDARAAYLALLAGAAGGAVLHADAVAAAAGRSPLPLEPRRLAIALGERLGGDDAEAPPAEIGARLYREAIGAVAAIFAALGLGAPIVRASWREAFADGVASPTALDAAPGWLHPARHGWLYCRDGERAPVCVGAASLLHPRARLALEVPAEVAVVELDLDALLRLHSAQPPIQAGTPPRFPGSSFDLTIPARATVAADALRLRVLGAVHFAAGGALEAVDVTGVFAGDGPHPRRVTLQVRLRRADRSLQEAEVAAARAAALDALAGLAAAGDVDLSALSGGAAPTAAAGDAG